MQDRNRRIGSNQDQLKVTISNVDRESPGDAQPEVDEEQLRTLWVGSLHENVDEEILYELFQNAGPLESIKIPKDRETKKQRNFGFVVFQHECSVKYAYDLLNNTQLFGNKIRLQNKTTGLGGISSLQSCRVTPLDLHCLDDLHLIGDRLVILDRVFLNMVDWNQHREHCELQCQVQPGSTNLTLLGTMEGPVPPLRQTNRQYEFKINVTITRSIEVVQF